MRNRVPSIALMTTFIAMAIAWPAIASAAQPAHCGTSGGFLSDGWLWAYLATFGAGFLTSLTPCVYPMIPIVVGIFGARDDEVTRARAFALATLYVLGMGVMYSILGIVFALIGKQFGSILANPYVVVPLVIFYAVLAASMFGAFELDLPHSWKAKLDQVGGKGYVGAFGMGLVGGLTAAPCTGPILAGILGWVTQTQNVLVGSTLLFTYAIGMGILFWVIAAFTVSLPKSGRWMEWVKSIGGTALLAVGVYFLRPIVPALENFGSTSVYFLIGSVLLVVGGGLLGAFHISFFEPGMRKVRKIAGIVLVVLGITGGISWLLTPERELEWQYDEAKAYEIARAQGKGVMIDFAADWCAPCKELELTFGEPDVHAAIKDGFVPLKFDVSKGTDDDYEKQERYGAMNLPAVLFLDSSGNLIGRVDMFQPGEQFMKTLEPAVKVAKGLATIDEMGPCEADVDSTRGAPPAPAPTSQNNATDPAPIGQAQGDDGPQARADVPAAGHAPELSAAVPEPQTLGSADLPASPAELAALTTRLALAPQDLEARAAGERVTWLDNDVAAFVEAEFSDKGVLIDFYASWCPPCVAMHQTYADQRVADAIAAAYVPVRLDVTHMSAAHQAVLENYGVEELPALVVLSSEREEITRITSYMDPETFVARLPRP